MAEENQRAKPGGNSIAHDQLRSIVERVERLEEEKRGIADDIKDIFAEAKGNGFCCKTLRAVIRRRKMDKDARDEADMLLDTYEHSLGVFS